MNCIINHPHNTYMNTLSTICTATLSTRKATMSVLRLGTNSLLQVVGMFFCRIHTSHLEDLLHHLNQYLHTRRSTPIRTRTTMKMTWRVVTNPRGIALRKTKISTSSLSPVVLGTWATPDGHKDWSPEPLLPSLTPISTTDSG